MEMYEVCLTTYGWDDKIGAKVCKTKEDADIEFINLIYENCDKLNNRSYIDESYIEKIEVYTDEVTRRFPNVLLFRFSTDDEEYTDIKYFLDDIENLIIDESDKKIEENTNIIKIELWDREYNNEVYITFGVNTTNCKTLEDILNKACKKCINILDKFNISKFVTMNKKEIIDSKFINDKENYYIKYCNIK